MPFVTSTRRAVTCANHEGSPFFGFSLLVISARPDRHSQRSGNGTGNKDVPAGTTQSRPEQRRLCMRKDALVGWCALMGTATWLLVTPARSGAS